jgi:ATP-dependent Clp protease ATP-binding subunit ClpA
MFERFTPRARRVIVLAQDTAREMGHRTIKPEHLLVALTQGEGMAAIAMTQTGVDTARLRDLVSRRFDSSPAARKVQKVPFSEEGKRALELSLREALALGHNYIGTEHLFLGVQRAAETNDESLDDLLGVGAAEVHARLMEMIAGGEGSKSMRSPALDAATNRARRLAGQTPMTTGQMLQAVLADTGSHAAQALTTLGVTAESFDRALASIPVDGTSDAPPVPMNVAISVEGSTTQIRDADIAKALRDLGPEELRAALRRAIGIAGSDAASA